VLIGVTATLSTGCTDAVGPTTGAVRVAVTTVGTDIDLDGYSMTLDGGAPRGIGATDTITISGVPSGDHRLQLGGVSANCHVAGPNPRWVTVVAGDTADLPLAVACAALTGSVRVTTATTGPDSDPNGYSVSVDGELGRAIDANGALTVTGLSLGDHVVRLDGATANCTLDGSNPRAVTVVAAGTADVRFAIACTALTIGMRVTTTTTGSDPDPDGYSVSVDGGLGRAIAANGALTITGLSVGDHVVRLDGVAANCTVDGANPRTLLIDASTEDIAFAVACIALTGSAAFASVSAGYFYSCGVDTDGVAYCWGSNAYGQLGDGSTIDRPTPAVVAGGLTFTLVSAGVGTTCGLTTGRRAYCWGDGYGPTPVAVAGGIPFVAITVGKQHVCGLTAEGGGYCWGDNWLGALGTGDAASSATPALVAGGLSFTSLSAGWYYTCGVTTGGAAYCWGVDGALGFSASEVCDWDEANQAPLKCRRRPAAVEGGPSLALIGTGEGFTCGLTRDGAAYCWGSYPESGSVNPVPVPGGLTFAGFGVAAQRGCGVATGGGAHCWGWIPVAPYQGEFSARPTAVPGGLSFAAVSVGWYHTCGVTPNGTAYCWGANANGELGNGSQTSSIIPVKVAGQP